MNKNQQHKVYTKTFRLFPLKWVKASCEQVGISGAAQSCSTADLSRFSWPSAGLSTQRDRIDNRLSPNYALPGEGTDCIAAYETTKRNADQLQRIWRDKNGHSGIRLWS